MRDTNVLKSSMTRKHVSEISISSTSEEVRDLDPRIQGRQPKDDRISISSTSEEVRDPTMKTLDEEFINEFPLVPLPKKCVT